MCGLDILKYLIRILEVEAVIDRTVLYLHIERLEGLCVCVCDDYDYDYAIGKDDKEKRELRSITNPGLRSDQFLDQ